MRRAILAVLLQATAAAMSAAAASMSEITVDLRMDASDYVVGERVRAVVDIVNSSPDTIGIGGKVRVWGNEGSNRVVRAEYDVNDRFFIEVYRTGDMSQLAKVSRGAFVSDFAVETGEGQKLETFIGDHFALGEPNRYMAKPVFVHAGVRYEGQPRVFDMVEGVRAVAAMQMFANRKSLQREFSLVYWARGRSEHVFLKAKDSNGRQWRTTDLGPILRIDKPEISVCADGKVFVLHRLNQDQFVRSEFWSLPDALEFRGRSSVLDPETAGTQSVRELYRDGGVKPKQNPWWKFW